MTKLGLQHFDCKFRSITTIIIIIIIRIIIKVLTLLEVSKIVTALKLAAY